MDDDIELDFDITLEEKPKRRRGRPPGKAKAPVVPTPRSSPMGTEPWDDYKAADPLTMVSRYYALIDWHEQALRQEMKIGIGAAKGIRADFGDGDKLIQIGQMLVRALQSHRVALKLAEDLSKFKTPEQYLRAAIDKIKGQDLPTLESIIGELREFRASVAHVAQQDKMRMKEVDNRGNPTVIKTVADFAAELEAEDDDAQVG